MERGFEALICFEHFVATLKNCDAHLVFPKLKTRLEWYSAWPFDKFFDNDAIEFLADSLDLSQMVDLKKIKNVEPVGFDFDEFLLEVELLWGSSFHILRLEILIILSLLDKSVAILEHLLKVLLACLNNGWNSLWLKFETLALCIRVKEFFKTGPCDE